MFLTCSRAAKEGTTPPYLAWSFIWDDTTLERTVILFLAVISITAIAVSSHDVSIPKIFIDTRFYHFYCFFSIFHYNLLKVSIKYGPIVYRLGRPVFNQVRGVRLPLGLPNGKLQVWRAA